MSNCETECWSHKLGLMAHALPLLKVRLPLEDTPLLVLVQVLPGVLVSVKAAVHGKSGFNCSQIMPEGSWSSTAITTIAHAAE